MTSWKKKINDCNIIFMIVTTILNVMFVHIICFVVTLLCFGTKICCVKYIDFSGTLFSTENSNNNNNYIICIFIFINMIIKQMHKLSVVQLFYEKQLTD